MDGGRRRPPYDFQFDRSDTDKRLYTQMDSSHHRSSSPPLFVRPNSESPDRHVTPPVSRLALPPLRSHYPRDAYDFRRPLSSAPSSVLSPNNVIDLTSGDDDESSAPENAPTLQPEPPAGLPAAALPRFGREIIDLSADTSPVRSAHPGSARRSPSPEVQFVSSRPRSRTGQPPLQPPPFLDPNPEHRRPVPELVLDPDDDVVVEGSTTGVNLLGPFNPQRRPSFGRLAQMMLGEGAARIPRLRAAYAAMARGGLPTFTGALEDDVRRRPNRLFAGLPMLGLNYETVAFDLGIGEETPQLPIPKFDPPPPVPEGFTRDPGEDDILICPNCEDELAIGESEEKRQVWVVKACGHVYCGTCMNNRKRRPIKSVKGKGRADDPKLPNPFSTCCAEDCNIRVSYKNDVMQIFL